MRLALSLGFLLLSVPAFAQNLVDCKDYGAAKVSVTELFDAPIVDHSKSLEAIQDIVGDMRHSIPQYHELTMGITRYEPTVEFNVPMEIVTYPNGISCAHVQHADVKIGYRDVRIYVAGEIPQNSCGFKETLDHEKKHIDVNREILDKFVPLIQERFNNYLRFNGNAQIDNPELAEKILNHKLEEIMSETINQMDAENMRRQRDIDSTGEYNRLAKVCGGELSRIARDYDSRH